MSYNGAPSKLIMMKMMTLKSCRSASHGGGGGDDGVMNIADYDVYILVSGNLRCQQD